MQIVNIGIGTEQECRFRILKYGQCKNAEGGAFVLLFRKELNVWRTLKFSNKGAGRKALPMCP